MDRLSGNPYAILPKLDRLLNVNDQRGIWALDRRKLETGYLLFKPSSLEAPLSLWLIRWLSVQFRSVGSGWGSCLLGCIGLGRVGFVAGAVRFTVRSRWIHATGGVPAIGRCEPPFPAKRDEGAANFQFK